VKEILETLAKEKEEAEAMKYIHYRDLAKFLAKSTTLSKNWKEFFDELSLSPDVMQQAVRNINRGSSHYEIFCDMLESWISKEGSQCNVKLLCEKLKAADKGEIARMFLCSFFI